MNILPASMIIPAYNVEDTIGSLLETLLTFNLVDEIIVVDDGSLDATYKILKRFAPHITIKRHKKNKGKAEAIITGIKAAKHDVLMFCDADLISIKPEHVEYTIRPVLLRQADMVIAIRETDKLIFKTVSGERALRKKDILPYLSKLRNVSRGMEIYINQIYSRRRVYHFYYPGLLQKSKGENIVLKLTQLHDYLTEAIEFATAYSKAKDTYPEPVTLLLEQTLKSFQFSRNLIDKVLYNLKNGGTKIYKSLIRS